MGIHERTTKPGESDGDIPVNCFTVILLHDLLWRHVHVRADKRTAGRGFPRLFRLNTATEICDDEMAIALHENIFRFQVSMQNASGVQRFNS